MKLTKSQRNQFSHAYVYPTGDLVVVFKKRIKGQEVTWCHVYPAHVQTQFKISDDLFTQHIAIVDYILATQTPIIEWHDTHTQLSQLRNIKMEMINIRPLSEFYDAGLTFHRFPEIHGGVICNCQGINSTFNSGDTHTRGYYVDKVIAKAA